MFILSHLAHIRTHIHKLTNETKLNSILKDLIWLAAQSLYSPVLVSCRHCMSTYMQIAVLLYGYFSYLCNFVLLETIMTTLAMDQFGWAPAAAIARMGYIIIGAGAMSILVFGVIGPLSKRYNAKFLSINCKLLNLIQCIILYTLVT